MSGKRTQRAGGVRPGLEAGRFYLPAIDESRSAWSSLSMATFRCNLEHDADLDVSLILGAVEALCSEPPDVELAATSVRIPANLRNLAQEVVEHRWVNSVSDLLVMGLREQLVALTTEAINAGQIEETREALDEYYASRPDDRADLTELAIAAAEIDGHPAASHPDLVARAVDDLADDAYIEDVLAWVRGALAVTSNPARS